MHEKTGRVADFRYGFVNALETLSISLAAARALVEYDGTAPLEIIYSVDKARMAYLKEKASAQYSGEPSAVIESVLARIGGLTGRYVKSADTSDTLSYKITIHSLAELEQVQKLYELVFLGRISLP